MLQSNFSPSDFLQDFWQKKPIVIKNFIANFCDPLDADELAGLALEPEVESRLVQHDGNAFQLSDGPFTESRLSSLPERDWTLLVQAVDLWVEEVEQLKPLFSFIPSWRIDDIMVSFAATGGSVGPHFDRYDVFLLQGSGSRRWRLGQYCDATTELDRSSGLNLLKDFQQDQEVTLNCGDVLYIPPGWAHWGISETESLCYSIGFRAPSHSEIIEDYSNLLMAESSPDQRYIDENPVLPSETGRIDPQALTGLWDELQATLHQPGIFHEAFGNFVTKPRYPALHKAHARQIATTGLRAQLLAGSALRRHPASRFAFIEEPAAAAAAQQGLKLFVDGECLELAMELFDLVTALCNVSTGYSNVILLPRKNLQQAELELVQALLSQGSLLLDEPS